MARSKNAEFEKLDPANMDRVILLLEGEKPITKKAACEALNISYNTARLTKLIEDYKAKLAREAARRAANRGKPATKDEISYSIAEYIRGEPISTIANSLARTADFVSKILDSNDVPRRAASHDYFKPELIPDGAVRERFKIGEVVYSARYDSTALIEKESTQKDKWIYRIWLLSDKWLQYAYQPAEELASLEHITAMGIKL